MMATAAVIFVTAIAVSLILTRRAIALQILDQPNERSSHSVAVPRTGGIAVCTTFLAGLIAGYVMLDISSPAPLAFGIFVALLVVLFAAALYDDIRGLGPGAKLAIQALCALAFSLFAVDPTVVQLPWFGTVDWGLFGHAVVVAWILYFINAFNFMDGINGIAGGTAAIALLFLALAASGGGWSLALLAALLMSAALIGFLTFNFPRGLIFLGDSGSQVIGFLIAALAVLAHLDPGVRLPVLFVPLLVFSFLFDVAFTLALRARAGKRLSHAHREHLYQRLVQLGWSHARVSCLHFALQAALAVACWLALDAWEVWLPWILIAAFAVHGVYAAAVHSRAKRAGLLDQ